MPTTSLKCKYGVYSYWTEKETEAQSSFSTALGFLWFRLPCEKWRMVPIPPQWRLFLQPSLWECRVEDSAFIISLNSPDRPVRWEQLSLYTVLEWEL